MCEYKLWWKQNFQIKIIATLFLLSFSINITKSDLIDNGIVMNGTESIVENNKNNVIAASTGDKIGIDETEKDVMFRDDESKQVKSDNEDAFKEYFQNYLKNTPKAVAVTSPSNIDNVNRTWNIAVDEADHIEVIVHLLDINPFTNYLYIRAGFTEADNDKAINITGPISQRNVQKIILMDTKELHIFFQFANSQTSKYRGFVLTYQAIGKVETTTIEPNVTISPLSTNLNTIKILLEIPKNEQNVTTWEYVRQLFTNSTNKFIETEKILVENCKPENVSFKQIIRCSSSWPNYENCVKIELAIPLHKLNGNDSVQTKQILFEEDQVNESSTVSESTVTTTVQTTSAPTISTTDTPVENLTPEIVEYELTAQHLQQMWIAYGKPEFARNNIKEYMLPNPNTLLFFWILMSLGIIFAFLIILYFIWKIDFIRDYRRMTWKQNDDQRQICKQSDIDISMFPSPHQIVPTLFPNESALATSSMTTGLPYEYINQPITFNQTDFEHPDHETFKITDDHNGNEAGVVPFQPDIIDFNEPQSSQNVFYPEDQISFSNSNASSPRSRFKLHNSREGESLS